MVDYCDLNEILVKAKATLINAGKPQYADQMEEKIWSTAHYYLDVLHIVDQYCDLKGMKIVRYDTKMCYSYENRCITALK